MELDPADVLGLEPVLGQPVCRCGQREVWVWVSVGVVVVVVGVAGLQLLRKGLSPAGQGLGTMLMQGPLLQSLWSLPCSSSWKGATRMSGTWKVGYALTALDWCTGCDLFGRL